MNALTHHAGVNGGFSLIEVMVAILILGIALVGLTHGITTALGSSKESEWQTTAALFAAGKIETLRAENDFENGDTDGDCGANLPAYRWKQTISDADVTGLHEVDVTIETAKDNQPVYELKTLLFQASSDANANGNDSKKKKGTAR